MGSLLRFDRDAYVARLSGLPPVLRAVFAAACAERVLTGVTAILERTRPRALETLRTVVDRIWQVLEGDALKSEEFEDYLRRCEALVPDLDLEAPTPGLAQQDDAALTACYAIRALLGGDSEDATRAAEKSYDLLDSYVTNSLGVSWDRPEDEDEVLGHPVIQAELRRQQRDLDELLAPGADRHDVRAVARTMRERVRDEGPDLYERALGGQGCEESRSAHRDAPGSAR